MRLTNTLTGQVEVLDPVTPGHVGLYVCGVTPYADSHIGHAMSSIVYDVLVRYLRWRGFEVTYVSNYTDIDDKIIDRAHELGVEPAALAERNIAQWEDEQRALGLLFPDVRPRVTREIDSIVALIERIVANGHAYATPAGDVYFRVRSQSDYGKLSHRNIDELRSGTRFEPGEGKEFPLDFALWKAAKPGEPSWPSPWGEGRPGWHIECSAMAQRYLGDTFDVHGGGLDLVFPHHENEVAQSEAATGKPFARLWMHNGLVLRDGEKMSKSIGNVVTVADALARWTPDAIRLFVLSSHYRSPNNLTDEALTAATRGVERLRTALEPALSSPPLPLAASEAGPKVLPKEVEESDASSPLPGTGRGAGGEGGQPRNDDASEAEAQAAPQESGLAAPSPMQWERGPGGEGDRFIEAMDDDLNTAQALAALFDLARAINRTRDEGGDATPAQALLRELADVLGLSLEQRVPEAALDARALSLLAKQFEVACGGADAPSTIDALLAAREEARRTRDFARSDAIRAALATAGVEIEDTPQGPRWKPRA